ncbi:MAG: hypothetical protein ABW136_00180 [Steroidobacteraceae bacterium]
MKTKLRQGTPRAGREPEGLLASYQETLAPLFAEFRAASNDSDRQWAALRLCARVSDQCDVDEEVRYPEASRIAGRHGNRLRAAQLEGLFLRKVIDQIRALARAGSPDRRRFAATVEVLDGYLADYVDQQRADVLPRLRRQGARATGVYTAMRNRRAEILAAR